MGSERAALTHHCNVIRRQVLEEFSDLTLLFVVHAPNKKDQAIADAGSNLLAYRDSGKEILEAFKANAKQGQGGFLGLIAGKSKGLIKKRQHFYALFLVNIADYKSMEEAQSGIYHLTWHAIDLYQNYSSGQNNSRYKTENGLISPRHTPLMLSTANFMADVFTALLLALTENDYKQLRKMAAYRAKLALSPSPHYRAELYPYPVAMETAELVYEDLKDTLDPKLKIYHRALQLAQEVGLTHDEQSIKQWWAFSARAQEMAWMEADAQKILNAAIYTSEDPYVKATAYLVAEALNIEPKMFSDAGNYNPFTESEVNERAHNKLCDKIYKDVLARVTGTGDPYYFMEEAQHQNEKLKSGHVSGWCAPALIALEALYKSGNKDWTSAAQETFIAARGAMPWNAMQKLAKGIMKLRRNGQSLTAKAIYEMAKDDPELLAAAQAFEATDGQEFKSAKVEVKKNLRPAAAMPSRHDRDLPPILSHIHGGGETQ